MHHHLHRKLSLRAPLFQSSPARQCGDATRFHSALWLTAARSVYPVLSCGLPATKLAPERLGPQASLEMDCDDFMLLLARPGPPSESLSAHLKTCDACRELSEDLKADDAAALAEDVDDEMIGTEIGAYRVERLLGAGGMGRVYLALHPDIESRVAIKVFSKDWNAHPALVSRFFAEAKASNVIAHENIVNVLDVGRLGDGRPYMVMEHLLGQPLSALIRSAELTDAVIKRLMLDVLTSAQDHPSRPKARQHLCEPREARHPSGLWHCQTYAGTCR